MKKALVMLASTLAMSGAFAQTAAPAATSAAQSAPAPAAKAGHERNVDDRIGYLHTQLKITPAQEPQWNTFADVMRSNGQTMVQLFQERKAATNLSALDDMKQYASISQAHADGMKKLVDAFDPLYNSFSPEQKKLADVTFRQPGGALGGRHDHHGKGGKSAKQAPQNDPNVKP